MTEVIVTINGQNLYARHLMSLPEDQRKGELKQFGIEGDNYTKAIDAFAKEIAKADSPKPEVKEKRERKVSVPVSTTPASSNEKDKTIKGKG